MPELDPPSPYDHHVEAPPMATSNRLGKWMCAKYTHHRESHCRPENIIYGLRPGEAMDLMPGYDFDKEEDRRRAWNIIEKDKPMLLVGPPECRMFSTLQNLSRWTNKRQKEYESAKRHLEFTCKLYDYQISQGRWFLHEHPVGASSWKEKCVRGIMKKTRLLRLLQINVCSD